jgi:iron(III) transport system substrate-binding protein
LVLALLLGTGLLAACGGEDDTASGEVVLYTSVPESIIELLSGVVEQRFPDLEGEYWVPPHGGITLRVERGRTADIQQRIANDIETTGRIQADVIWLAEPSPYETYKDMGLLAPYLPPAEAPIPAAYIDPDGYYVAGRVISMVIAWNTSLRPDGLSDWLDLAGVHTNAFPAPESGAARATIKAITETQGLDFFSRLEHVGGVSVPSNGAARDGLVEGQFEAVAVLDYMARQAKEEGSAIDFAYPDSGTVLIPSPIAITADAPNPGAAEVFVDFILSQAGQEIVVQIGSFYPARTDVAVPSGAPPLEEITALAVDWRALAADEGAISEYWEEVYGAAAPLVTPL